MLHPAQMTVLADASKGASPSKMYQMSNPTPVPSSVADQFVSAINGLRNRDFLDLA